MIVNSYNIYEEENYSFVMHHAIAESEEQVRNLAEEKGIDLQGLTIDLVRKDVRDELHRPYKPFITSY